MRPAPQLALVFCSLASLVSYAAEPAALAPNVWNKLQEATITGRRYETPLGYSPELKRFLVLGGRASSADFRKPRSFDELALDVASGQWENWFPTGKDWGPKLGPSTAPAWKNEKWIFADSEGNVRPNWAIYGTFSLGHAYDYDPDTKTFLFFAHGKTFRYDPAARTWTDLQPATDPERELGGVLLWSSLCYDHEHQKFVLFGGGNVQSKRGDPGTWTYSPADNKWEQVATNEQPPQRANSQLVYDPVAKQAVLFGGDQLSQLVADTWTFDLAKRKWTQLKPERSPSPRAGHSLVWLPKAKRVALIGGYEYTSNTGYVASMYQRLPVEIWSLDTTAGKWQLHQRAEAKSGPAGPANGMWHAAANENDLVVTTGEGTWQCQIDVSRVDEAGTKEFGVVAGSVQARSGPYDPAWFTQDVPAPDLKQVEHDLANLPANEWVVRPTPKLPRPNMDWGSSVFIAGQDKIVRFSGGHSAYSGTAPIVYDIKTDRYSLAFAPEMPIEFVYSNDQIHGEWSFQGNPWMSGHTYKATGYEPHSQTLAFAAHDYTYFFDTKTNKWSRNDEHCRFTPNMYVVTLATTPQGMVVWADWHSSAEGGLWRLDGDTRSWRSLHLKGKLHDKSPDRHGMAYDSKRDRLLFFSAVGKQKGDVAAYDLKTGENTWLNAAGNDQAAVSSRETIYLPEHDAVLVGARVKNADDDDFGWLWYDCAKNAWFAVELAGADPIAKGEFNNSMGLMHDPARKLIWAVGQNSHVHVLRLEPKQAKLNPL